MKELPPFPLEAEIERLFGGAEPDCEPTGINREFYLDLAEAVVAEAVHEWLTDDGHIKDPFEENDRWEGGTAARFACPAAIAARQRRHKELIEPARKALDQICGKIAQAAKQGGSPFPPGVLDLMAKEVLVACHQLAPFTGTISPRQWYVALAALDPETMYTAEGKIGSGSRANNYEAYACVAEWMRYCMGLGDRRDWVDRDIGRNMEWLTAHGLYRDPGDPALYDLSVRQNYSELLQYGYDGQWAEALDELLRRGGLTMLLTLSPNGWAPYGGRSNLFVHNEAMVAYIAEFEAIRWKRLGNDRIAGAFKQTARRAALVAEHYLLDVPMRNIKNRFDPATKHGRDSNYGEFAIYSLLAASLFARTYLVADDSIDESAAPVGSQGTFLHLYPEFHRTFASCGDTQVQIDTAGQPGYDATGIGRIHRRGVPEALGLSLSLAADPKFITARGTADRAAAIGPAWRTAGGSWETLAACSSEIRSVDCRVTEVVDDRVRWDLTHELSGLSAQRVEQSYVLTEGALEVRMRVVGEVDEVALEVPCLVSDAEEDTALVVDQGIAVVTHAGASLRVNAPRAERVVVDDAELANRQAVYRLVSFRAPGDEISGTIELGRD